MPAVIVSGEAVSLMWTTSQGLTLLMLGVLAGLGNVTLARYETASSQLPGRIAFMRLLYGVPGHMQAPYCR